MNTAQVENKIVRVFTGHTGEPCPLCGYTPYVGAEDHAHKLAAEVAEAVGRAPKSPAKAKPKRASRR